MARGPGSTAGMEAQAIGAVQATTAEAMLARAMLDEKGLGEVPWHADRWVAHAVQWAAGTAAASHEEAQPAVSMAVGAFTAADTAKAHP